MQLCMDCPWRCMEGLRGLLAPRRALPWLRDVRWLRNHVVAPLSEELVFRACMLPVLLPCAGPRYAVLACPLFFGLGAHGKRPIMGWAGGIMGWVGGYYGMDFGVMWGH
ncbi:CAAX prenyl protease 2, partial [Phasianus colchicus]|uniref:CAAX prenyl protease 2 n=1 Tax=Phasianus colchicus TaxID=9054 RepID=UPI00129EE514